MAVVLYQQQKFSLIKPLLQHALKLEPQNTQVSAMLQDLSQ
jgi:hypothetical protein